MERNARYLAVGTFVLALTALAVGFVLWYSKSGDRRNYAPYEIHFTGSVSGLSQGSQVRYLGVDIGRVRRMGIDPKQPGRVRVLVDIDSAAPISSATRASLKFQGLTGLLFIDLKQANAAVAGPLRQGELYPIIESEDSGIDVVLNSLPELVARATAVFSDDNLKALKETLQNLRATTSGLPQTASKVAALVDEVRDSMREINGAAAGIRGIAEDTRPDIKAAVARLKTLSENLADASARVDRLVADGEAQLGQLSNQGLFELERLLRDARAAANEFRDLSRSLKQNPSQLLYERPPSGVEIPR